MCGLIYIYRKDGLPAYKAVLKRYRKQKSRGTEGYGYVAIQNDIIVSYRRATTEHEIVKMIEKETASEILFHHRNPTSTPNIEEEAHPLLVESKLLNHQYFIAHNGVIRNDDDLKKKHEALGIEYATEITKAFVVNSTGKYYKEKETRWNDSESLAIETALAVDGYKKTIDTEGYAAVIGLQTKGPRVVSRFFYRNQNPLNFQEDSTMIQITSEGAGDKVAPWKVQKLKQGGGFEAMEIFAPEIFKYAGTKVWNHEKKQFEDKQSPLLAARRTAGYFPTEEVESYMEDVPYQSIQGVLEEDNILIRTYTEDTLWSEYDKTLDGENQLKRSIASIDSKVESGEVSEESYEIRQSLQARLDKVLSYQKELDKEITTRTSYSPIRTQQEVLDIMMK